MNALSRFFTAKITLFLVVQILLMGLFLWVIAGNDRLFGNVVPIEQRLISKNESIRKKAQQELLGMDNDRKKRVVERLIPALQQDDLFVRKWASISMALIGPSAQQAIPYLLQSVSAREKEAAQAARVALSEIGAPDAHQLPSLLRALQDPRNPVKCEAAHSIGKMGPAAEEVVPVLMGFIKRTEETPACFEDALAALAQSIPGAYPPLLELLSSSYVELRRKAARVLAQARIRGPENVLPILEAISREPDGTTRAALARSLQLSYPPEARMESVLSAALKTSHVPVRMEAARYIRQSAKYGKQHLTLILRMVRDSDSSIRRLGLEALRKSGQKSPDILQTVARAQRDNDPGVRCRAAESLIELGSPDRVSISLLMGDLRRDEDTARCAENVLGLAGLFDQDVIHSMTHVVSREQDPDVRSRAARVLMHLGPRARQAEPALLRAREDKVPGADMALRAIRAPISRKRR